MATSGTPPVPRRLGINWNLELESPTWNIGVEPAQPSLWRAHQSCRDLRYLRLGLGLWQVGQRTYELQLVSFSPVHRLIAVGSMLTVQNEARVRPSVASMCGRCFPALVARSVVASCQATSSPSTRADHLIFATCRGHSASEVHILASTEDGTEDGLMTMTMRAPSTAELAGRSCGGTPCNPTLKSTRQRRETNWYRQRIVQLG
jgi:hypothetical protein